MDMDAEAEELLNLNPMGHITGRTTNSMVTTFPMG